MNDSGPVIVRHDGAVAHLRFNRPQALNTIDADMARQILAAAEAIGRDPSVRAVVLSGAGKAFMAGGDLLAMKANPQAIAKEIIAPLHRALLLLASIDAPVIASVHGVVAGAGVSLMLNADLAVAAEGTRFNLAYINIGTSSDGGAPFALPRIVGLRNALEIALLGDGFDAAHAKRLGLVNRLVPSAELKAETLRLAQRLAAGPTRAIRNMRRLLRGSFESSYGMQLDAEEAAFAACAKSSDFVEGVQAFFDKRSARFQGS